MPGRKRTLFVAALVVVAAIPAASGGAFAQSSDDSGDESYFDALVSDDGEDGYIESFTRGFAQQGADISSWVSKTYASYTTDPGDATEYANATMATFNSNNESIAAYANDRLAVDTDHDVFAVHFNDRAGNNFTRYVVSTATNDTYTNARMLAPSQFGAANRSVDYHVTMDWYASSNANSELETFVEEYASTGDNLTSTYKAEMLATYGGGSVTSGLWNNGGAA